MLDDATVQMLRRHWEEGWNDGDLDTIMAPFADEVVFSSPGIAMMTRDPSRTTIRGSAALRDYLEHALRLTTDVRYTLHAAYAGTDSIVLVYSCGIPNGTQRDGADSMRLDGDGKVVEWRCHF
jgi:ketosteroid isomerase-like protein